MKIEHIKNGALYYNNITHRVERVIGFVSPVRVLTYWHKTEEKSVNAKHLRKATNSEVAKYIEGQDIPRLKKRVISMISKLLFKKVPGWA